MAPSRRHASERIPCQAILALPVLFTAGMSLMDTFDRLFMNVAYGWAFFNPVRVLGVLVLALVSCRCHGP